MSEILQETLPVEMQGNAGLPGMAPAAPHDWLRVDEAYGDRNLMCTCPPMESYTS